MKKLVLFLILFTFSVHVFSQKIFKAYAANDYDKIEHYLKNKVDPNILNKNNLPLLFMAASSNNLAVAKLLIKYNATVDIIIGDGKVTPLFMACANNSYDVAAYLIEHNANVNHQVEAAGNQTPIRFACKSGSIKLVRLLLENNASLEDCPNDCITPLIQAARSNHFELVKFLIEKGANINHQARDKECALNQAIKNRNVKMVAFLKQKGAKNMNDKDGLSSIDLAKKTNDKTIIRLVSK